MEGTTVIWRMLEATGIVAPTQPQSGLKAWRGDGGGEGTMVPVLVHPKCKSHALTRDGGFKFDSDTLGTSMYE